MTAASNTQGITLLAYNKQVSGSLAYGSFDPNPRYARTSDTRQTLGEIASLLKSRDLKVSNSYLDNVTFKVVSGNGAELSADSYASGCGAPEAR